MSQIKEYVKKNGQKAYMFKIYIGVDPITGKQKQVMKRGFKSITEAKAALNKTKANAEEILHSEQLEKMYFSDVFEEWMPIVYKHKVKESTYWNTYGLFKNHILPEFKDLLIDKITVRKCQKIVNNWAAKSPKRFYRFANYAGMVFKYALSVGIIDSDPMSLVSLPVIEEDEEKNENFYDRDELVIFLEQMKKKYPMIRYTLFHLLAYTGLRKGEALNLTWGDIDFENQMLSVNKTMAAGENNKLILQKPKTKSSFRKISLDDTTIDVLIKWKNKQAEDFKLLKIPVNKKSLIFSIEQGEFIYPRTPQSWLDSFYNKNPKLTRITPHGFRHTHASLLFEAGATMKQVQTRLGHTTIKTTMNVYTHVIKSAEKETAELFSNYISDGK